jgi:hypothetical protein
MEQKSSRKYNTEFRKKLVNKIYNLSINYNKNFYIDIYNIIIKDEQNNISTNSNGILVDLNILSDNCINKLNEYIKKKQNNNLNNNKTNLLTNYISYKIDDVDMLSELGHKLSNHEKNIIKKIKQN